MLAFRNLIAPDAVQQVLEAHSAWSETLPAFLLNEATVEAGPKRITVPVATFAFLRPNGVANWSMEVGGNQVTVECLLYTRWKRVWDAASGYLRMACSRLADAQSALQLASIELTVRDVFISAHQDYKLGNLFYENSGYLSPTIFATKGAWHSNVGWFETSGDSMATLNHLNADAAPSSDQRGWAIGVTHLQQERFAASISIANLFDTIPSMIDVSMSRMHSQNKRLLLRLLKSEMTNKIGLALGGSDERLG